MSDLLPLLVMLAISGFVGWLIGGSRGRGTAGWWLGFFLGPIGWIIALFIRRSPANEAAYRDAVDTARRRPLPPPR